MAEKKIAYRSIGYGCHGYYIGNHEADIASYLHPTTRCISRCGLASKVWATDTIAIKVNFYRFGEGNEGAVLRKGFIETMERVAQENDAVGYRCNSGEMCYAIPTNSIGDMSVEYIGWTAFFRNADDAIAYYTEISAEMERITAIISLAADSYERMTAARKIETALHNGSVAKEYLALEKALA